MGLVVCSVNTNGNTKKNTTKNTTKLAWHSIFKIRIIFENLAFVIKKRNVLLRKFSHFYS
jgi:hypothetical protein